MNAKLAKDIVKAAITKKYTRNVLDFFRNNPGSYHGDLSRMLSHCWTKTEQNKVIKKWLTIDNLFQEFVVQDFGMNTIISVRYHQTITQHEYYSKLPDYETNIVSMNYQIKMRYLVGCELETVIGPFKKLTVRYSEINDWCRGPYRKTHDTEYFYYGDDRKAANSFIAGFNKRLVKVHRVRFTPYKDWCNYSPQEMVAYTAILKRFPHIHPVLFDVAIDHWFDKLPK